MAISVESNLTDISTCDAVGTWTDAVLDTDWKIQGSGCMADQVKGPLLGPLHTFDYSADMTGKHFYIWAMVAGRIDTLANGGIRLYLETNASNYAYWYVAGNETYTGGWKCFVIDPDSTPTSETGTLNPASITKVGIQFNVLSSVVGQAKNCFWDVCRYGTGLTITSGATDQISLEDIYDVDNNADYKYGVITKLVGAYVINGLLIFGKTGSEDIDFVDKSQMIIFPDNDFVSDSFYGIKSQCGTGTSNFVLGEKSGSAGIKGCLLKAVGTKKFSFDMSDNDNDKVQIYGTIFNNAGVITLPPRDDGTPTNREILNCIFESCGQVVADTCTMTNCNFISATDAILISDDPYYVTNCNFISCTNGVELDTVGDGEYDFVGLYFADDVTYDVNNTSGSSLTVANDSDSNADSYTGSTVNFSTSIQLTLVVKDEGGDPVVGASAYIDNDDQSPYILNTTTDQDGEATTPYGGSPITNSRWRVRKYGYIPFQQYINTGSENITLPVTLIADSLQS